MSNSGRKPGQRNPKDFFGLTPREYEIAKLISEGYSNKAIGNKLVIMPRTIEHHISMIIAKLGTRSSEKHSRVLVALWVWEINHELFTLRFPNA